MSTLSLWSRRGLFADDEAFDAIVRRAFTPVVRPVRPIVRPTVRPAAFVPAADLVREGDDAVLRLELPGIDVEKDVALEVVRGRLVVKGERRSEQEASGGYREVRYGQFQRSFGLPEYVSADAVSASYDAGVLTVRVAGAYATPQPTAQRVAISVGSTATTDAPSTGTSTEASNGTSTEASTDAEPAPADAEVAAENA